MPDFVHFYVVSPPFVCSSTMALQAKLVDVLQLAADGHSRAETP